MEVSNKEKLRNELVKDTGRSNIQDMLKSNPELEAKRKANHAKAMQGNVNNLKHGKFSTQTLAPLFQQHISRHDGLDFRNNPKAVKAAKRSLIHSALRRLNAFEIRETASKSDMPNAQLTKLYRDTYAMLVDLERSEKTSAILDDPG